MTYIPACSDQSKTTSDPLMSTEGGGSSSLTGMDLAAQEAALDPNAQPGFAEQTEALIPPAEGCSTFAAMDVEIQSMLTYLSGQQEASELENAVTGTQDAIGTLSGGLTRLHGQLDTIVSGEYEAVVDELIASLKAAKSDVAVTPQGAVLEGVTHSSVAALLGLIPGIGDVAGYLYSVASGPVMTGLKREAELAAAEDAAREAREETARRSGKFAGQQEVLSELVSGARSELQSLLTSPYSLVYPLGEAIGGVREIYYGLGDQQAHYLTEEGDAQTADEHEELTQLRDELAATVERHDGYLGAVATAEAALDEAASVGIELGEAWVEDMRFAYLEWVSGGRYDFGEGASSLCWQDDLGQTDCMAHPKGNLLLHGHKEPTAAIADLKVTDLLRRGETITVYGVELRQQDGQVTFHGTETPPGGFGDWQAFYDFLDSHTLAELAEFGSFGA